MAVTPRHVGVTVTGRHSVTPRHTPMGWCDGCDSNTVDVLRPCAHSVGASGGECAAGLAGAIARLPLAQDYCPRIFNQCGRVGTLTGQTAAQRQKAQRFRDRNGLRSYRLTLPENELAALLLDSQNRRACRGKILSTTHSPSRRDFETTSKPGIDYRSLRGGSPRRIAEPLGVMGGRGVQSLAIWTSNRSY